MAEMPVARSTTLDFDSLVHTHSRYILNIAYAVLRNSEDAEDVAQETFFRAFRSGELGKVERIHAWLGRIAWRLAVNRWHQRSAIQQRFQPVDLLRALPAPGVRADELLIRKERGVLLENLLGSLPRNLREAFVLLTVEEMTSRNAAEILGIPESSVRDRLSRARRMLKEKLRSLMESCDEA